VVVRTSRWTIDRLRVSTFLNKTYLVDHEPSAALQTGMGYFIQDHRKTLDKAGEWFFDQQKKQVFLYSIIPPSSLAVEVSVFDYGIVVDHAADVVINNISFSSPRLAGIRVISSQNPVVRNSEAHYSGVNGIEIIHCTNPSVKDNAIDGSNNNGVQWENNSGGTLTHNTISKTGVLPGLGESGSATYIAINMIGDDRSTEKTVVDGNSIDHVGYSAIDFRTANTSILNNRISHFCMVKDDGGGIYTWQNSYGDILIEGNTVASGIGAPGGTLSPTEAFAHGIYIDDRSKGIHIKQNTISACAASGIFLHNVKNIVVERNTTFGNNTQLGNKQQGEIYLRMDTISTGPRGLNIKQNKLSSGNTNGYSLFLAIGAMQDLTNLGIIEQNQYRSSLSDRVVGVYIPMAALCIAPEEFSLTRWQQASHFDKTSTIEILPSQNEVGRKMIDIANGNESGWIAWPDDAKIASAKSSQGKTTLSIIVPNGKEALVYYPGLAFQKEKIYRLELIAQSRQSTYIEFVPMLSDSPWSAIGDYTCFSIDTVPRTHVYYFRVSQNSANARLNFKSNTSFEIYHLSVREIPSGGRDSTAKLKK
jgi:parallel beta-helix repeat protein